MKRCRDPPWRLRPATAGSTAIRCVYRTRRAKTDTYSPCAKLVWSKSSGQRAKQAVDGTVAPVNLDATVLHRLRQPVSAEDDRGERAGVAANGRVRPVGLATRGLELTPLHRDLEGNL